MWAIIKYKKKEYLSLVADLKKKLDNKIIFYNPKVKYFKQVKNKNKAFENFILEGYAFCFYEKFKEKEFLSQLRFTKGLEYFLNGSKFNQINISNFINYCKSFEKTDGYLSPCFFSYILKKKGQFLSGPFENFVFDIIKKQKSKMKIQIGNFILTVSEGSYLVKPL